MARARIVAGLAAVVTLIAGLAGAAEAGSPPSITLQLIGGISDDGLFVAASGVCLADAVTPCEEVEVSLFDPEGADLGGQLVLTDSVGAYEATIQIGDGPCGDYTVLAEGFDEEISEEPIATIEAPFLVPCEPSTPVPTTGTSTTAQPTSDVSPREQARPRFTG